MRGGLRSESEREDVRSDVRSDSVRAAEIRAQEILDSLDGSDNFGNELDIPANLAPEGWEYELKRVEVDMEKAKKWDGKLPVNMYSNAPMPFLNLGK